jgi:hypothetical protein
MLGAYAARVVVSFDGAVLEERYVGFEDPPLRVLLPSQAEPRFVDLHPGALGDDPLEVAEGAFAMWAQLVPPPRPLREGRRPWGDKAALAIVASLVSLVFAPFLIVLGLLGFSAHGQTLRPSDDLLSRARALTLADAGVQQVYPSVRYTGPRAVVATRSHAGAAGPAPHRRKRGARDADDVFDLLKTAADQPDIPGLGPVLPGGLAAIGGGEEGGGDEGAPSPSASKEHDDLETISLGNIGTIARDRGAGNNSLQREEDSVETDVDPLEGEGSGTGEGDGYGSGDGHSILCRGGGTTCDLRVGVARVGGTRDKESIRRVIRAHLNEVKFCYESNADGSLDIFERLVVEFVIAPTGEVASARYAPIGMPVAGPAGQRAATCVTRALARWTFGNAPGAGVVRVSYPFSFKWAGSE